MEYKEETTSIQGTWPLEQWRWKHETSVLAKKFLEALKDKKIIGLKCPGCGLVYVPPKPYCRCLSIPDEWVEVKDTAVITTYTFTGSWSFGGRLEGTGAPLVIAGVMYDGSDTQTLAILDGVDPDDVAVGKRTRVKWPENPQGGINDIMHSELI
jgi:hypothetical protein